MAMVGELVVAVVEAVDRLMDEGHEEEARKMLDAMKKFQLFMRELIEGIQWMRKVLEERGKTVH